MQSCEDIPRPLRVTGYAAKVQRRRGVALLQAQLTQIAFRNRLHLV